MNKQSSKTLANYELLRTISKGTYRKVKLARSFVTQQEVAIYIHKDGSPGLDQERVNIIENEMIFMSKMDHNRLINILDYIPLTNVQKSDGKKYQVLCSAIMEVAKGGNLQNKMKSGNFKESHARYLFLQILEGLEYMHSQGCCHRDLRPENILFTDNFDVKLNNFSFSCAIAGRQQDGFLRTIVGTLPYQAPEIYLRLNYKGEDVDIFSLGVILFMMVAGLSPLKATEGPESFYRRIMEGQFKEFCQYLDNHKSEKGEYPFTAEFMDLVEQMLEFSPDQRIKLAKIREHPWLISGDVISNDEIRKELSKRQELNEIDDKISYKKKNEQQKPDYSGLKIMR